MAQMQLIPRLTALRATIRRRLLAYGACAVLTGGMAAFLTIVMLDWMLELPPWPRTVVAALFLAGFAAAALRWIVRPMHARLGIDEIAARLEAHFSTLKDRLLSTINFIEHGDAGSKSMMRQVVTTTERMIREIPLESVLSLRPIVLRALLLVGSGIALITVLSVSPGWARTGLYRYVHPWGGIEWPRDVSLLPLTGDQTVAVGDSVTVRMRVQRGLTPVLRGVVHLREPDGDTITLAMQRDRPSEPGLASGTFYATIDALTRDLQYWFEAGDDNTVRHASTIRVCARPQAVEALVAVEPPPYAPHRTARVQDLRDPPLGGVTAPIGGQVLVTIRANKPIRPGSTENPVGLRTRTGELIPLDVDPEDRHKLSSRFEMNEDVHFRLELWDKHGLTNRGAGEYTILAIPDAPPTITVLEPTAVTEITPNGSVRLALRIEDDFGITRLDLSAERVGGSSLTWSLTDQLEIVGDEVGVQAVAKYLWNLEALALAPGEVLTYRASAADNHPTPDGLGQIGHSAPMRIQIITNVEFDVRLQTDMAHLETRIRQAALDQADLLDRTTPLLNQHDEPISLTDPQRGVVATLSAQQARLARRLRDLAGRFYKLTERMERNHAGDDLARRRVASLGDALQQIAADPMTNASAALQQAASFSLGDAPRGLQYTARYQLREAARLEDVAIQRLHALLRTMSRWGSFHELVTKTRDLLDRQRTLRIQTAQLGKSILGKLVEALTEAETARLKRAERRQEQLANDVEQLLARMTRLAPASRQKDPSGADAIDGAIRAARAHDLSKHMQTAVASLDRNRTAAATIAQKAASDAIRKMIAAFRERDARALEELRKRIDQAGEQVALLIEQQQDLRQATHEASLIGSSEPTSDPVVDEETFDSFARQQRTIKGNAGLLGEELADAGRTSRAARLVRQATVPMGRAEVHLQEQRAEPAARVQDEALVLLNNALARLDEMARETADEALRRSLEQIREDLEQMLEAQLAVNAGIGKLKQAIEERGRIRRPEARAASKLARQQADVRSTIEAQMADFQKVMVYEWALKRVAGWMDQSRRSLSNREIDNKLVVVVDRIARELKKLIDAIIETESLPTDTEFVESEQGGGGRGRTASSKAVPTVAELLVLKAMQADINVRTQELYESVDMERATEEQLRELKMLGEDQAEVHRLTEMVAEGVKHP